MVPCCLAVWSLWRTPWLARVPRSPARPPAPALPTPAPPQRRWCRSAPRCRRRCTRYSRGCDALQHARWDAPLAATARRVCNPSALQGAFKRAVRPPGFESAFQTEPEVMCTRKRYRSLVTPDACTKQGGTKRDNIRGTGAGGKRLRPGAGSATARTVNRAGGRCGGNLSRQQPAARRPGNSRAWVEGSVIMGPRLAARPPGGACIRRLWGAQCGRRCLGAGGRKALERR